MVEFKVRIHPTERQTYIPKLILESLGPQVTILPNMNAAVLYTTGADLEFVAKSVEIILQDLRLRTATQKKKALGIVTEKER